MANGLGRGLGSLIPNKDDKNRINMSISSDEAKDKVLHVPLESVHVNPMQPRKKFSDEGLEDLVNSIKEHGVLQPLIVTKSREGYELIAGERRLRATKQAGHKTIPVIVRESMEDQEKLELALIENIQRENLNAIECAEAYRQLIDDFNMSQEDVSRQVGKSRPTITNTLRLLTLPDEIKIGLIAGKISEGHGKYLAGLDDEVKQMNLYRKIIHNNLTVSDTSKEVRRMGGTKKARIKINYQDKDKEFAFREFFGTKVEIRRKGKGGQIIVDFFSEDELGELVDKVK